jgi:putative transposase
VLHKAVKVRLYPTPEQEVLLAQHFGCARWWWNFALNKAIETYRDTGKGLGRDALNALLPHLKKDKETEWLGECYSQVLPKKLGLKPPPSRGNFVVFWS